MSSSCGLAGLGAPRLAGQHVDYLELQMRAFALAGRIADPMNHHVWVMTPEQMRAVATYLGG
jgi:cytochrome c553